MESLNKDLLRNNFVILKDLQVKDVPDDLPERVIQFGEGNFLRAFVDWMIHQMNKNGYFNGKVVVVQPIPNGLIEEINQQDGLYTLILRGLQDGKPTEVKEIISSISRGINPYKQWEEYLACAENPDIEFVISNTTEAGIAYDENDCLENTPPHSYPGKLTAYLYHRFKHFNGEPDKGMVIIPCELIDRNGDNLKKIVLQLAEDWSLPEAFKSWIKDHNLFLNTLVDRVVTGYPKDDINNILKDLGYEDKLVDTGELFHLWVIEGPKELSERLPFTKAGLNVIWTDDMTPYRTRKVRILNGAHTSSVPAAFLYGLDTVGEMMDHEIMGKFTRQVIYDEIIPSIDLDKDMLIDFADSVVDRFRNPYIKHYLVDIMLNSSSKFKTRVLPSILQYKHLHNRLPERLTFSLAALIAIYKNGKIEDNVMRAKREKGEFTMKDDLWVLKLFEKTWENYEGTREAANKVTKTVLANSKIWGEDLSKIEGLTEKVSDYLHQITDKGIKATIRNIVN